MVHCHVVKGLNLFLMLYLLLNGTTCQTQIIRVWCKLVAIRCITDIIKKKNFAHKYIKLNSVDFFWHSARSVSLDQHYTELRSNTTFNASKNAMNCVPLFHFTDLSETKV